MASHDKNLITCVEFGTHSVKALHGTRDKAGNPVVLGIGQVPSDGAVCKGEIVQMRQAAAALEKALASADKSAGIVSERRNVYCIVNGPGVTSRQGEGQVIIYDEDRKIRRSHIQEAVNKAQSLALPAEQVYLSSFDSFFLLDSRTRVQDPEGQTASRLEAFLHIFSASRNQLETTRDILRELGFEDRIEFVFAPVAAAYGVLQEEEKNDGVLLIDMGAGTTTYIVIRRDGILASGILPIGTENIANDLSIGLDLSIEQCRKMLIDQTLSRKIKNGEPFIDAGGPVSGTKRKIPVGSFERIMDLRLREIYSILRERLDPRTYAPQTECGIVFCGGGALIPSARKILGEDMRMPVRPGIPFGLSGAMSDLETPVRHAALLGLLKYVTAAEADRGSAGSRFGDALEDFGENLFKKVKDLTSVFKI
ncbi:MAG: cell division protein FtsA [Lentisphaeria bacterium]|nr:cell division protein FtsA [Lentisphaeria bacterium]